VNSTIAVWFGGPDRAGSRRVHEGSGSQVASRYDEPIGRSPGNDRGAHLGSFCCGSAGAVGTGGHAAGPVRW